MVELWGYSKCQEFDLLSDFLKLCSSDYGAKCNSTTADCGELLLDDEAACPPDSVPKDPSVPRSPCECAPARCMQPVCRFGSSRELRRTGTKKPGDCCDVYECVQPKGNLFHLQNCWTGSLFPSEPHDEHQWSAAGYYSELCAYCDRERPVRPSPSWEIELKIQIRCFRPSWWGREDRGPELCRHRVVSSVNLCNRKSLSQ